MRQTKVSDFHNYEMEVKLIKRYRHLEKNNEYPIPTVK